MTTDLKAVLSSLKLGAKPKRWAEPPPPPAICRGVVMTCCVENGALTLAVSRTRGVADAPTEAEVRRAIAEVFGEPEDVADAQYPSRGATAIYRWGAWWKR